jgi:hypothetical protein
MDYCTLARVRSELRIKDGKTVDDAILSKFITDASRSMDKTATGVPYAENYFMTETVVGEQLLGQVNYDGKYILVAPHKPLVTAVTAFSYQEDPTTVLFAVAAPIVSRIAGPVVKVYPPNLSLCSPSACDVTISYTGGLGATVDDLPEDLQEMAALLSIRYYREAETGLGDQIGVAELASLTYTKAWPIRLTEKFNTYVRKVGWHHLA